MDRRSALRTPRLFAPSAEHAQWQVRDGVSSWIVCPRVCTSYLESPRFTVIWRFQYSVVEIKVSTLWSVRCQLCHVKRGIELSGCFVPCVRRDVMIDDCTGSYPGSSTYLNSRES